MKKLFPRLLALILVLTMLPISAFASLENHNVSDVTLAQSTTDSNYYFPDIVMLPDGRLIACYYQATTHVANNSYGVIYLVESTDNGYTWSDPWKVVDRTSEPKDTRDPNLAVLPNGTLVLTYFIGAGGSGTFMLFSEDGGRTWSEHIQLESEILDMSFGKRGTIAVINDENMLIPVYGVGSGNNSYGAPATATGKGEFSSYHRDAVMLHYQLVDGQWTLVYESLIGQEIDETALLYTGEGVVNGSIYDGDVWAFSREDGTVRVTKDCGRTWQVMAKEEPRAWTTSGTIMSAEQIIQPRFVQIADGCWFATYASYTVFNYPYDKQVRPVYGKIFFPEAGWNATQSKLIYDEQTFGVSDMADPATVLTAEGRLLTIYYNTGTKSIAGTFSDLSDWLDVDADSFGTKTVEREFWQSALANEESAKSVFEFKTHKLGSEESTRVTDWTWSDAGARVEGPGSSMESLRTISGDYSVQFNFTFSGISTDASGDDRDEGFYVLPLYDSNNPNRTGGNQYRVKYSPYQGVQLTYNNVNNSDYFGVLAGARGPGDDTMPTSLAWGKTYTTKIAKIGDGLYIKTWLAGTAEPGWQAEYHDASIDVEGSSYNWKFRAYLVNKPWTYNPADTESVLLSDMHFNTLEMVEWNYDGKLTKTTYGANTSNGSGFTDGYHKVKWNTETNGFAVWQGGAHIGTNGIFGDYNFSTEFTFQRETSTDGGNGMTFFPQFKGHGTGLASYRIVLTTHSGLQMSKSPNWTPGYTGEVSEVTTNNNDNTSFTVGKTYILEFQKTGNKLYVKTYEKGTTDTNGWDYVLNAADLGEGYPCFWFYYDTQSDSASEATAFKVDNMDIYGYSMVGTEFWKTALSEPETIMHFSNAGPGWSWPEGGFKSEDTHTVQTRLVSKQTISGDYTGQLDFYLGGSSTDTSVYDDRDEGFFILPLSPVDKDPSDANVRQYRIRLSATEGAQLTNNASRVGDYGNVLAGKLSTQSAKDSTYVSSTLPQTLDRNTVYTVKWAKQGDTLSVKVWKKGTTEPGWQCVYSNSSVDVSGEYKLALFHYNKGSDDEYAFINNAKFNQLLDITTVEEVGFKEEAKWTFATAAEGIITSGTISKNGETYQSTGDGTILSSEAISGNYNAFFTFTAGESWGDEGLWLEPVWESTNPLASKHQIQLTSDYGIRVFTKGPTVAYPTVELTDEVVISDFRYEEGQSYNVKVSKAYDTLTMKIWNVNDEEPLGWNVYWQQDSIGSMVYYKKGSYSYPYDFSRYGDLDSDGNPYQWHFLINYKTSDGTGIKVTNLELSKAVTMELNYTELTVNAGETPKNVEMNTTFYPNIFAQLPTPEGCVEYSTVTGNAETTRIIHNPGVRIQRAYVTGVAAGNDTIIASYPGIVDSEGNVVKVKCAVTVNPANNSTEFKGINDGYMTQVIYEEDFEDIDVYENVHVNADKTYTLDNASYNAMSEFFDYAPFYEMAHMSVLETEDGDNRYLKTYSGSGSTYAGVPFQSKEKLTGDYTFQADVYLPNGSTEFRLNLSDHKGWSKPANEGTYVRTFGGSMTSLEKMEYADYQFGFRQWMTRGRLNSSVGIYLFDEAEAASGWQTVKAVKAGNTVYFKSWAKGTEEPDWELIFVDEKLAAADAAYGGFYLTIDFDSNYTNKDKYSTSGEILMDNVRVTRQIAIDGSTVISDVTLNLNGGTLAEGKNITKYAEGSIVDLPIAEDLTKKGYTFEGWYDNAAFEGEPVTTIPADATGDLTFYAKWTSIPGYIDTDNLGPAVGPNIPDGINFVDVPATAWYHEAVEYAVLNGLMTGISTKEFAPNSALNRAMVVTVLWRMEGEPKVSDEMTFTDVPAGQWYTEAVRWAAAQGIVNGIDAQTYAPLNAVTREQLVTILWRYAQKKGYDVSVGEDTNILSYADVFSVSEYAIPAMQWACGAGLINGNDDGTLNPKGNTKRSEFAKVIMYFCENVVE